VRKDSTLGYIAFGQGGNLNKTGPKQPNSTVLGSQIPDPRWTHNEHAVNTREYIVNTP
jgi:hypothetical protein